MPDEVAPPDVPVLYCDDREDEDRLKEIGRRRLYRTEKTRLPVADYWIGPDVIEFKTCVDFVASMTSGHLENQLNELEQYGQHGILVICGNIDEVRYTRPSWRSNPMLWNNLLASYRGQIWSILEKRETRVLQVRTVAEFCDFLVAKAKRLSKGERPSHRVVVTQKSRDRTLEEEGIDCLCAITGVGFDVAKALLGRFGSVVGVGGAGVKELMGVDGVGKVRAAHIHAVLYNSVDSGVLVSGLAPEGT